MWQLEPLGSISVEIILAAFGWTLTPALSSARRAIMADGVFGRAVGQSVHRLHGRGAYLTLTTESIEHINTYKWSAELYVWGLG